MPSPRRLTAEGTALRHRVAASLVIAMKAGDISVRELADTAGRRLHGHPLDTSAVYRWLRGETPVSGEVLALVAEMSTSRIREHAESLANLNTLPGVSPGK